MAERFFSASARQKDSAQRMPEERDLMSSTISGNQILNTVGAAAALNLMSRAGRSGSS
jgi:hypothetical protein